MSQLLVFGVDSPQTAEKVLDLAQDLAKQQLLELAHAAWVERTMDGNVKLHQSVNLTAMMAGSGAVTGALWGTLIGLLFLNPSGRSRWSRCGRRNRRHNRILD
jgi:uncharacterized membrane protein